MKKTKYWCVVRTCYEKDGNDRIELAYVRQRYLFNHMFEKVVFSDEFEFPGMSPNMIIGYMAQFLDFSEKLYGECSRVFIDKNDAALIAAIKNDPFNNLSKHNICSDFPFRSKSEVDAS